jgi:murein DD-endopeptidase MepM/ murein hydrolase activator NlpD
LIEENRTAKRKLEGELKQREVLMASIKSDMGRFSAQIKKKRQEVQRLDKEIDRLIKEAIVASTKEVSKKTSSGKYELTPANKKLASNFEANKGKLGWPVSRGVIKGKFGKTRSLTDSSVEVNNSGVKIATERNAKVKAVFNGEVTKIIIVKRGNPGVIIRHGNYYTIYYNLSNIFVKPGEKIVVGQELGEVFTNKTTGETLLDFRIYKNDKKFNPESWLSRF